MLVSFVFLFITIYYLVDFILFFVFSCFILFFVSFFDEHIYPVIPPNTNFDTYLNDYYEKMSKTND